MSKKSLPAREVSPWISGGMYTGYRFKSVVLWFISDDGAGEIGFKVRIKSTAHPTRSALNLCRKIVKFY